MAYPRHARPAETKIIDRIIREALAKNYLVSVYEGEQWSLIKSSDYEAITADIHATDLTQLKFTQDGLPLGSIVFIHGNDEDVIHDWSETDAINELIGPI